MAAAPQIQFSGPVTVFRERRLPEAATPAGYSALIDAYDLKAPLPRMLSATGEHHRIVEREGWRLMTPRHAPQPTLEGHLTFALKYEGLDLAVLKRLFGATGPRPIEALVQSRPTATSTASMMRPRTLSSSISACDRRSSRTCRMRPTSCAGSMSSAGASKR